MGSWTDHTTRSLVWTRPVGSALNPRVFGVMASKVGREAVNPILVAMMHVILCVGVAGSGCSSNETITGSGEGGEESGVSLSLNETYDRVRGGVRLVLSYDAAENCFTGFVENTADTTLQKVRVEVHLSNGIELGPTTPADLGPGVRREVKLCATGKDFDAWTAHPEVGGSGEGGSESGSEGGGEHSGSGSGEEEEESGERGGEHNENEHGG